MEINFRVELERKVQNRVSEAKSAEETIRNNQKLRLEGQGR